MRSGRKAKCACQGQPGRQGRDIRGSPTLVEFGATGCGPCDMMQPILENLRRKNTRIGSISYSSTWAKNRFWVPDMVLNRFLCKLSLIRPARKCSDTPGSTRRLKLRKGSLKQGVRSMTRVYTVALVLVVLALHTIFPPEGVPFFWPNRAKRRMFR